MNERSFEFEIQSKLHEILDDRLKCTFYSERQKNGSVRKNEIFAQKSPHLNESVFVQEVGFSGPPRCTKTDPSSRNGSSGCRLSMPWMHP